jgi:putative spermidine/putrescine transport system ATP-binding protein
VIGLLDVRVCQYDSAERFYQRPASLAVARFFGGRNLFPGLVQGRRFKAGFGGVELAEPAAEGRGVLVVRQEAVEVVGAEHSGAIAAVVSDVRYLGTHTRVTARVGGGDAGDGNAVHLTVDPTQRLAPGDRVALRLPPEHLPRGSPRRTTRRLLNLLRRQL